MHSWVTDRMCGFVVINLGFVPYLSRLDVEPRRYNFARVFWFFSCPSRSFAPSCFTEAKIHGSCRSRVFIEEILCPEYLTVFAYMSAGLVFYGVKVRSLIFFAFPLSLASFPSKMRSVITEFGRPPKPTQTLMRRNRPPSPLASLSFFL